MCQALYPESCFHGFFFFYLASKCWRAYYESLDIFSSHLHSLLWRCHLLPRLSTTHLLVTHNSDFYPRFGWPVVHLSSQQITNLVHVKLKSWGFSLLPKPVPSLVFPICKHSTKHSPHRGLVLGSYIPCPVASNSPELELDLTAEKQQDLIISHPKDYCKWPGPNRALPHSCPLILTSR